MKKFAVHSAQAAACVASMLAVPAVLAQDAPVATNATGLEEVTVTARRREESLQDVPIAVSAFSADRIEATGAPDITWLQQSTPNLTLQVARGSNSTLIAFIRGVGQQDPLWGFEPGVGLYVDDVYIARPQGAVLDIYDVERLEVLRGPQGTLYGRNTIGGAIKYVTRPLGHDGRFDAKYTLGSYGQHDVALSGVLPAGERLSLGASAAISRHDGYGDNRYTGDDHYAKDVEAYRLSADWTPTDAVSVRIAADHVRDDSPAKHGHREIPGAGLAAGEVVLGDVYDTRGGIGDENEVMTRGVAMTVAWQVNEALTFKSITAYREGETDTLIDFDAGPTPALDVPGHYEDDQTTQELQLLFEGERLQGVAGLYYLDATASGAFDTIVGLANLTIATAGEVGTRSYAAFADVSYDFTDRLRASVGGRYTSDERTGTVYRQNFTGLYSPLFGNDAAVPGLLRTDYKNNERTFDKFTPRVSVSFDLTDVATSYASYSEGFKSGGFDMRGDAVLTPGTVDGYDPEQVQSYELGLKGTAWDDRLSYNAAIFRSDYTDQQITRQEPAPTGVASFVDNAGSSTIQGVELEGAVSLTDRLSLTYGVGWTDAEFDEYRSFTVVDGTPVPVDLAGLAHFQNTPEWNGNLALTYVQPLSAGRGSLATLLSASYRDAYYMFEFDRPLIDQTTDYTLLDASVTWTSSSERFRVQLAGRNLTDEEYRIGGYDFYTDQTAGTQALFGNTVNGFYGPPRTYSVSLSYRFD